jgi:hypothetical protein
MNFLAVPLYESVLAHPMRESNFTHHARAQNTEAGEEMESDDGGDFAINAMQSTSSSLMVVKQCAAYNLAQIYSESGNQLLARKVLMENIVI